MIRNRRANTKIEWTKRQVETIIIDFLKRSKPYMMQFLNLKPFSATQ